VSLGFGTSVGGCALGVDAAFVADADGTVVVMAGVDTLY